MLVQVNEGELVGVDRADDGGGPAVGGEAQVTDLAGLDEVLLDPVSALDPQLRPARGDTFRVPETDSATATKCRLLTPPAS